jgi:hypothetical protein
MGTRGWS